MSDYSGPERRATITFTREDSDRLVRLEGQLELASTKMDTLLEKIDDAHKTMATQSGRISKLERRQSWFMGVGAAIVFIISVILGIHKGE